MDFEADTGLSALANLGGVKPMICPRRINRPIMAKTRLIIADLVFGQGFWARMPNRQTPNTVIPDSLQNMARVANKTVKAKNGFLPNCLPKFFWYWSKVSKADRKNIPARISARPTIPATASVWIGWRAKAREDIVAFVLDFARKWDWANWVNRKVAMQWSNTLTKWKPYGFKPDLQK